MTAARFEYVTPNDVFASLADGGTIRVEEWPYGDLQAVVKRVQGKYGVLLLEIDDDLGSPTDAVSMHPDEDNRLALIERGIRALKNARDALTACGYVDGDELGAQR
jgi:hypothetical protein